MALLSDKLQLQHPRFTKLKEVQANPQKPMQCTTFNFGKPTHKENKTNTTTKI